MKPPILSERQFEDWCKAHQKQVWDRFEAQLDADAAYYEQKIRELFEEIYGKCSLEVQNIHSSCAMDKLIIRRGEFQFLKSKYTGGKKC